MIYFYVFAFQLFIVGIIVGLCIYLQVKEMIEEHKNKSPEQIQIEFDKNND